MADIKISQLPEAGSPADADLLPVVQDNDGTLETRRMTRGELLSGKANTAHTHGMAEVTGLPTALDAKADLVDGKVPAGQLPSVTKADVGLDNVENLPVATQAEAEDANVDKYLTATRLGQWWAKARTVAQAVSGLWTFGGNVTLNGSNNTAPNQAVPLPSAGSIVTRAALARWFAVASPPYDIPLENFSRVSTANLAVGMNGAAEVYGQSETRVVPSPAVSASLAIRSRPSNLADPAKIPEAGEYAAAFCRDPFFGGESGITFINSTLAFYGSLGAGNPLILDIDSPAVETHGYLWFGGFDITTGEPVPGSKCYVVETKTEGDNAIYGGHVRLGVYNGSAMSWSDWVQHVRVGTAHGMYHWVLAQDGATVSLKINAQRYYPPSLVATMPALGGTLQYGTLPPRPLGVGIRVINNDAGSVRANLFMLGKMTYQPLQEL